MRLFAACLAVLAGLGVTAGARAAVNGSVPVICATMEIMECAPQAGCQRVSAEAAGIPKFLHVNFADQEITHRLPDGEAVSSTIERSETVDGRIILQGAEDGLENVRDGIGWSLSIDQETGNMVVSGSGMDVAFVIFGACTAL